MLSGFWEYDQALPRVPVTFTTLSVSSDPEARPTVREAGIGSDQIHTALPVLAEVGVFHTLIHIWGQSTQGAM